MILLTWIASKLKHREIFYMDDQGNNLLGLDRYGYAPYVPKKERGNVAYLHNFHSRDYDGHHSHPWKWAFSIVLKGSYTEERLIEPSMISWEGIPGTGIKGVEVHHVRWFNILRAHDYHKIIELHGPDVWTLFVCGPLTGRSWGFWMPARGHVHWETRIKERKLEA